MQQLVDEDHLGIGGIVAHRALELAGADVDGVAPRMGESQDRGRPAGSPAAAVLEDEGIEVLRGRPCGPARRAPRSRAAPGAPRGNRRAPAGSPRCRAAGGRPGRRASPPCPPHPARGSAEVSWGSPLRTPETHRRQRRGRRPRERRPDKSTSSTSATPFGSRLARRRIKAPAVPRMSGASEGACFGIVAPTLKAGPHPG